ncbi:MAG TPA: hypothetical protein VNP96_08225 [Solirubrobacterales bacterium]|nr:hypothetical protein [Solirubrobacterales bacterium]
MERFVLSRNAASYSGVAIGAVILIAVFVLGAPAWTFVPISMAGMSLYARLRLRALDRLEQR